MMGKYIYGALYESTLKEANREKVRGEDQIQ